MPSRGVGGISSLGFKICGGITGNADFSLEFLACLLRMGWCGRSPLFPVAAFLSFSPGVCKEYAVTIRPTEASERCRLRGSYTLRTGVSALELWGGPEPGTQLYDWPYRFLRRFGRDKVSELSRLRPKMSL